MAEPKTSQGTEQRETDADRMAARGTQLPPVPGEGQPVEDQPGQRDRKGGALNDPAAFDSTADNPPNRPSQPRAAGGGFTANDSDEEPDAA